MCKRTICHKLCKVAFLVWVRLELEVLLKLEVYNWVIQPMLWLFKLKTPATLNRHVQSARANRILEQEGRIVSLFNDYFGVSILIEVFVRIGVYCSSYMKLRLFKV